MIMISGNKCWPNAVNQRVEYQRLLKKKLQIRENVLFIFSNFFFQILLYKNRCRKVQHFCYIYLYNQIFLKCCNRAHVKFLSLGSASHTVVSSFVHLLYSTYCIPTMLNKLMKFVKLKPREIRFSLILSRTFCFVTPFSPLCSSK